MYKATIQADMTLDYAGTEAVNTLCSNLTFAGRNVKKVVVTSCEANDGKSFMAMQIVKNMAERGRKTVFVDADMRLSVLLSHYSIQLEGPKQGLAHFLSGQAKLDNCLYATNIPNFYLIPIGADVSNPLGLLNTPDLPKLLDALAASFDLVVVDAPPVGLVIDAAEIARCCDGSVIVLEYNKTHMRDLKQAKSQLEATGTPILGCVLNKVSINRLSTKKYYYHYSGRYNNYYNHYYTRNKDGKKSKK